MSKGKLTDDERDQVYRALAHAVTDAGPERESLVLARLALLMAETIGDADAVKSLIDAARLAPKTAPHTQ